MKKLFILVSVLFFTASCVGKKGQIISSERRNIKPPSEFLENKGSISIVWSSTFEVANLYENRGKILLENEEELEKIPSKLRRRASDEDLYPHIKKYYLKNISESFASKGFKVKKYNDNIRLNNFNFSRPIKKVVTPVYEYNDALFYQEEPREAEIEVSKKLEEDVFKPKTARDIAMEKYNTDYVLILSIESFGINYKNEKNVLPISKITSYLIDRKDGNSLIGEFNAIELSKVDGNWNHPPVYPLLFRSLAIGFDKIIKGSVNFFLSN